MTVRSAGLLGLLAQTAGTARTAKISAFVENLFTWCRHLYLLPNWLPDGAIRISCKFGQQVAPLA